MNTKKIETLVVWLILALAIQYIFGGLLKSYIQYSIQNVELMSPPFGLTPGRTFLYSNYLIVAFTFLVNIVISLWLYKTAKTKKLLWATFGILGKFWALPIFAMHWYLNSAKENNKT